MNKLCPSAQPGMDGARVRGVVRWIGTVPRVGYLSETLPATPAVLALSGPLQPTEVFRLAANCAEKRCPHFDGADCRLATRIVRTTPQAQDRLPPCIVRKDCRWYAQECGAACRRCPSITTVNTTCRSTRAPCRSCR